MERQDRIQRTRAALDAAGAAYDAAYAAALRANSAHAYMAVDTAGAKLAVAISAHRAAVQEMELSEPGRPAAHTNRTLATAQFQAA